MNGDSTGGNRGLLWDLLLTGPGISQGVRFKGWRSCLDYSVHDRRSLCNSTNFGSSGYPEVLECLSLPTARSMF